MLLIKFARIGVVKSALSIFSILKYIDTKKYMVSELGMGSPARPDLARKSRAGSGRACTSGLYFGPDDRAVLGLAENRI